MISWISTLYNRIRRRKADGGIATGAGIWRNGMFYSAQDRHPMTDAPCRLLPHAGPIARPIAAYIDKQRIELAHVPPTLTIPVIWYHQRKQSSADLDRWADDGGATV